MISCSSSMASSDAGDVVEGDLRASPCVTSFARDLPNCMTLLPPPCMPESMNQKKTPMQQDREEEAAGCRREPVRLRDLVVEALRRFGVVDRLDDVRRRAG